MLKPNILLVILLTMINVLIINAHSTVNIMMLHSTQGSYANVTDFQTLAPHWYVCIYIRMYIHIYIRMYLCVYVHPYICK
jgi:hypothetical protein